MKILGIDEAGRGCVIGPLVVAGVVMSSGDLEKLNALRVRDSKRVLRAQRARLAREIERLAQHIIVVEIEPDELDENLTAVELRAMGRIIWESGAERVYLDLPVGPLARDRFQASLDVYLHQLEAEEGRRLRRSLVAENRADAKYPIVGAASIIAKVHRDRAIERLHQEYGDFGWGYPGEPKTRKFLKEFYERMGRFPPCARHKWRTLRKLAERSLDL